MNCQEFKRNITEVISEANDLLPKLSNQNQINQLQNFLDNINVFKKFIEDDQGLYIIDKASSKNEIDLHPLDILCNKIFEKLQEINPFLQKNVIFRFI